MIDEQIISKGEKIKVQRVVSYEKKRFFHNIMYIYIFFYESLKLK